MGDPLPPPQVSPDGKFYWDGQVWQPMPSGAPAPAGLTDPEPMVLANIPGTKVILYANRIEIESGFGFKKREAIPLRSITDVSTTAFRRAVDIRTIDGKRRHINASDPKAARDAILARM